MPAAPPLPAPLPAAPTLADPSVAKTRESMRTVAGALGGRGGNVKAGDLFEPPNLAKKTLLGQ